MKQTFAHHAMALAAIAALVAATEPAELRSRSSELNGSITA